MPRGRNRRSRKEDTHDRGTGQAARHSAGFTHLTIAGESLHAPVCVGMEDARAGAKSWLSHRDLCRRPCDLVPERQSRRSLAATARDHGKAEADGQRGQDTNLQGAGRGVRLPGRMYFAGISRAWCPSACSLRLRWCAPTQASMPIRHGGRLASRAEIWPRDHFCRSTIAPRRFWPTMWNEFLPISMPITAGEVSSFCDMACSLSSVPPCQHSLLAGQEHGRTIPSADLVRPPGSGWIDTHLLPLPFD